MATLDDRWRTAEGFTDFPAFRLSMSGDWGRADDVEVNTAALSSAAYVYFTHDTG